MDRFNQIGEEMAAPDADFDALMAEMGKLQDEIDAADGWDIDSKLGQAMDALQLPDSDMPVNVLSGVSAVAWPLCKLLLEAPDLLLLDEPTNHLDAESVLWLEHFLKDYPGAVLAVTPRPLLPGQTSPNGFARSTAATFIPTRATTPPI